MPIDCSSPATASANGSAAARRAAESSACSRSTSACARRERLLGRRDRVVALAERGPAPGAPPRRASTSSANVCAAVAAPQVGEPVELGLDLLEPPRLGLERREERAQLRGRLAELQLGRAQRVAGRLRARARGARAARPRARPPRRGRSRPRPSSGASARGRSRRAVRELADVPQALALGAQLVLAARLEPVRVRRRARAARRGAPAPLAASRVSSSCARRAACSSRQRLLRRRGCRAPANASSTPRWYAGRASRRCSNWPLIAISASAAAATSSRAALRPQA